jgi:hypothetical protein
MAYLFQTFIDHRRQVVRVADNGSQVSVPVDLDPFGDSPDLIDCNDLVLVVKQNIEIVPVILQELMNKNSTLSF